MAKRTNTTIRYRKIKTTKSFSMKMKTEVAVAVGSSLFEAAWS